MTRITVRSAICFLAIIRSVSPAPASDVFVSPRLAAEAGYENNRLGEPGSGEGSPFWQVGPGLDVTAFGVNADSSLLFDYRRTQYTQDSSEITEAASGFARWRYHGGLYEAGASLGGGLYRDKVWPEDDYTFWQVSPQIVRTFERLPLEVSLNGTFRQTFYEDSVDAAVANRVDNRMDVRPELRWLMSRQVTVWTELHAEQNVSDAPAEEYSGYGASAGCEFRPAARLDLGVWAGIGTCSYPEKVDNENRRDTRLPAGVWASYRLRPWLELFASADWESNASTIDDNDYSWWQISGGLRIVLEHELGAR